MPIKAMEINKNNNFSVALKAMKKKYDFAVQYIEDFRNNQKNKIFYATAHLDDLPLYIKQSSLNRTEINEVRNFYYEQ